MHLFFSPGWVAAVDRAIQDSDHVQAAARGRRLVFEQVATGSPMGEASYHVVVDDAAVRALPGPADDPTVTVTGPWEVHVRINRGELAPPVALLTGKGRVSGDRIKLVTERELLTALHAATSSVPAAYEAGTD